MYKIFRIVEVPYTVCYDYTRTVHQLIGLTGQNMEVVNQSYYGQLAYSLRFM